MNKGYNAELTVQDIVNDINDKAQELNLEPTKVWAEVDNTGFIFLYFEDESGLKREA